MTDREFNDQINAAKDFLWKIAKTWPNCTYKNEQVPKALTILDAICMGLLAAAGDALRMKVSCNSGDEIDVLYTTDGTEPTWHKYVKVSVIAGTAEIRQNSIN